MALRQQIQSRVARVLASSQLDRALVGLNRLKRKARGAPPRLMFFYDFENPYCANAIPTALGLEGNYDIQFEFLPLLPAVPGDSDLKERIKTYRLVDARREAERLGLPAITGSAPEQEAHQRLMAIAQVHKMRGADRQMLVRINRAVWHEGRTLGSKAELARLISEIGFLDPAECLREAESQTVKSALQAHRATLQKLGHWETPLWSIDGALFHGSDRHDFLLDALAPYRRGRSG